MKKHSGQFRRLTALALALCMLAALTAEIFAADIIASGYCGGEGNGKNLTWTLDSVGTLTISGKGKMADYWEEGNPPWNPDGRAQIKRLVLEHGITSIGKAAFFGCYGITGSLTIPDSVVSIGDYAFAYITDGSSEQSVNFTGSLTIPDSVVSIGREAFFGCSGFNGGLHIGKNVTSIGACAFRSCYAFTGDLVIPDSVRTLGEYAFAACGFDGQLTISNNIDIIENGTFAGCQNLTGQLVVPNDVNSIGEHAFMGCSSFEGLLTIPDKIKKIGSGAFLYCDQLSGIRFLGNAPSVTEANIIYNDPSFPVDSVLYYCPDTAGWTDSEAYDAVAGTWSGYKLEAWTPAEDENPQFISRTPDPDRYLVDGSWTYNDESFATITMKFNREVESVQAGGLNGDFKVVRSVDTETVYSLAEGDHAVTDVKIDGKTVSIRLSATKLEVGKLYFILMDYGVIKFKNTDKSVGTGGTEWKFKYSPKSVFHGFTLGKHNNSFWNSNSTKKGEAEYSGFLGITSHKISDLLYYTLMSHTERTIDRLHIELQLLPGRWNGCCHGISSTMLLAFANKLDLSQFENGVKYYVLIGLTQPTTKSCLKSPQYWTANMLQ